jgi:hypothetical protein
MTVTPYFLQKPLEKFERIAGIIITGIGWLLLTGVMIWLGLYLYERGLSLYGLEIFLQEWRYWGPVLWFLLPVVNFLYFGRMMRRNDGVGCLVYVEVFAMLVALSFIGLTNLP